MADWLTDNQQPPPLPDGSGHVSRHVKIVFSQLTDAVQITETFEPETVNSDEVQRAGWLTMLENFKRYVEK